MEKLKRIGESLLILLVMIFWLCVGGGILWAIWVYIHPVVAGLLAGIGAGANNMT